MPQKNYFASKRHAANPMNSQLRILAWYWHIACAGETCSGLNCFKLVPEFQPFIFSDKGENMRHLTCLALALACLGPLQAQSPNFGLSIFVSAPSGRFAETKYQEDIEGLPSVATEGYDVGFGGQFTMSFPLQKTLAFRAGIAGMSSKGTSTMPGYETIFLRHTLVSLSGEFQIFLDDAYRHRGGYVIAGISGDFERFERSYDDRWDSRWDDYSEMDVERKNRLGGILGVGHTFYGSSFKFTVEAAYHTSLTGKDFNRGEPIGSDFVKVSLGLVF
jgi:hypothetical protein